MRPFPLLSERDRRSNLSSLAFFGLRLGLRLGGSTDSGVTLLLEAMVEGEAGSER